MLTVEDWKLLHHFNLLQESYNDLPRHENTSQPTLCNYYNSLTMIYQVMRTLHSQCTVCNYYNSHTMIYQSMRTSHSQCTLIITTVLQWSTKVDENTSHKFIANALELLKLSYNNLPRHENTSQPTRIVILTMIYQGKRTLHSQRTVIITIVLQWSTKVWGHATANAL